MINPLPSISVAVLATLSKAFFNSLSALCLGAIFHNVESRKIRSFSAEIADKDQHISYNFFNQINDYLDKIKEGEDYNFNKLGINPINFVKQFGTPFKDPKIQNHNPFRNSPFIEYAVFHNLNLDKILDFCDFKSNPQITKDALTYKDVNGLNLINHAMRNRVALGNKLTAKIVDIYVENLDKKTILESLDKFVLTLPPEQFKKIVDKVGAEDLQKIIERKNKGKINERIIRQEISKYHSPDIFPSLSDSTFSDLDGYNLATIVKGSTQNPSKILSFVKDGNTVQIGKAMMLEIDQNPQIKEQLLSLNHNNIFISESSFHNGILATKSTLKRLSAEEKESFKEEFDISQTALENFIKNLKVNREYLKQNKPSTTTLSPQSPQKNPQPEL